MYHPLETSRIVSFDRHSTEPIRATDAPCLLLLHYNDATRTITAFSIAARSRRTYSISPQVASLPTTPRQRRRILGRRQEHTFVSSTTLQDNKKFEDKGPSSGEEKSLSTGADDDNSTASTGSSSNTTLSWQTFDYGPSPKWDSRFIDKRFSNAENPEEYQQLIQNETTEDETLAKTLSSYHAAWKRLSPETVQTAIQLIQPFVTSSRVERIRTVLSHRTTNIRFLFETPTNPSNAYSSLRTLDAFGIQYAGLVVESSNYNLNPQLLSQKKGVRTAAKGSAQWMSTTVYPSTQVAVECIRSEWEGCQLYASDLNPTAVDIRDMTWRSTTAEDKPSQKPICIVMGNEERGISDEMRKAVDGFFTLPMVGFAESFNLSVATAIVLAHLSNIPSLQKEGRGLSQREHDYLLLKGLYNSLSDKRVAHALLSKCDIQLPEDLR